ncbi:MAG: nuclear transport factor 2 family protein [Myxococcota bacterium]|nr:nuclear transport factor 2 family protein [Myxococcota bacterium]
MPTPNEMRATLHCYLERVGARDVDGVLELFADDVSVEDPVGGAPGTHVVGRKQVEAFFRKGFARSLPRPRLHGEISTTADDHAAMSFTLELELGGVPSEVDVIDVVRFDRDGRIAELRAYWNADEIRTRR